MGAGTWILLGIGAIAIYTFFIGPLSNPNARKALGMFSGDKASRNKTAQELLASDPNAAAKLKQQNPDLYNRIQQGNAFYGSGYRY